MSGSIDERVQQMRERMRRRLASLPADQNRRRFDYDRARLVNPYLAERDAGATDLVSAVAATGLSVGYPAWNLLYYMVLCGLPIDRPAVVVETGTNEGFSTIVLAQALRDSGLGGVVLTTDVDPRAKELATSHLAHAGLADLVELEVADSLDFLRRVAAQRPLVDFAFLDGDHSASHVVAEFELVVENVVRADGKVFFDNASSGGVDDALRTIKDKHGGNLLRFDSCSWGPPGAAVWQR